MRVFYKSCGLLKIMRVLCLVTICLDLHLSFLWSSRFSICNTGFLCSYRVIYKQVGSSMQPTGQLCAMRVFYTSCASFVCNAGDLCSLRLSVELAGFLCSLRVFCVAYGLLYALKGVYVAYGFSMQLAENLNIFNFEPFRAFKPDFFCWIPYLQGLRRPNLPKKYSVSLSL